MLHESMQSSWLPRDNAQANETAAASGAASGAADSSPDGAPSTSPATAGTTLDTTPATAPHARTAAAHATPTTKQCYEFFATCPRGFEQLLARELASLQLDRIRPLSGRVSFFGTVFDGYRACLCLSLIHI